MREVKFEDKVQKQIIKDFCTSKNCGLKAFVKLLEALKIPLPTEIREVKMDGLDIVFRIYNLEKIRISGDVFMVYAEKEGTTTAYIVNRFSNSCVWIEEWYSEAGEV